MTTKKFKSKKLLFFIIIVILIVYAIQFYNIYNFPSEIYLTKGNSKSFNISFPFTAEILKGKENILKIDEDSDKSLGLNLKNSYNFKSKKNGVAYIKLKVLGLIPVKDIQVNVIDKIYLIPGGNSIGVKLNTKGVLVVSLSEITGVDGKKYNPAKEAGIRIGDTIISINGTKIKDADHVIDLLNKIHDKVIITIERNKMKFTTTVKPVRSKEDKCYRLGIWVRDKTAGIGTLTFYHKESRKFGALGHGIVDIDTGNLLTVDKGQILNAKISSINHGKKGQPGEIIGMFFESEDKIGTINKNTLYGIYGKIDKSIDKFNNIKPFEIGLQHEVKEGKAYILTTIDDNKVEMYEIEITKLEKQKKPSQKSMVLKITDKRLLKKTGGIVQGMSGSPIIQNGKIIGAVTHVFINDPTKGYGLYIEWMLKEAGINLGSESEFAEIN